MKKILLVILCGSLPSGSPAQTPAQTPADPSAVNSTTAAAESLTVMTWNLEWFFDDEQADNHSVLAKEKTAPSRAAWDWRRDAIAKSISEVRPSILAVQEVESRRVLWYLSRSLKRNHQLQYQELGVEGRDHFTEQDVGLLIRSPVDVVSVFQGAYPNRIRSNGQFYDVSKHLLAVLEYQHGVNYERVIVMNVHLRSRPEGEAIRLRQGRLVHHWIAEAIKNGENVILLGDFNTEETGETTRQRSDLGIASGLETPDSEDDLVDLNLRLASDGRQTHMLDGRQFDRIFCSPSLLKDDPSRLDLVFTKIEVRPDLAIRGQPDTPEQHWETYWKLPADERDLSDHYPVMATFVLR